MTPLTHRDLRGELTELLPLENDGFQSGSRGFAQVNLSRSIPGVIRGLHYQCDPPQGKLVSCVEGRIFDVVADVREGSATFGQYVSVELDATLQQLLWIPGGYAHGFAVLGDSPATVIYWLDVRYDATAQMGVAWDDPTLAIEWPTKSPVLSDRDRFLPWIGGETRGAR